MLNSFNLSVRYFVVRANTRSNLINQTSKSEQVGDRRPRQIKGHIVSVFFSYEGRLITDRRTREITKFYGQVVSHEEIPGTDVGMNNTKTMDQGDSADSHFNPLIPSFDVDFFVM